MRSPFRRSPLLALISALALLNGVFLALEFPWAGFPPAHAVALEAVAIVGLLALIPPFRGRRWLTGSVALFAVVVAFCALGDTLMQRMQGRSLNLYTDLGLIPILLELMVSNLGYALATALVAALGVGAFLLGLALQYLLRRFDGRSTPWPLALALGVVGVGGLVGVAPLSESEATDGATGVAISALGQPLVGFIDFEWQRASDTRAALETFGQRLATEPAYPVQGQALPGLADIDVVLGFIESYGVAAVEREPFADTVRPRLAALEQTLDEAGLSMVTGRVTAATLGGQSWLNHATFLSGLPVTSQLRFELMMNRPRSTLIDDFTATGHRTLAVMPGITRAWPEGERYGYDEIHVEATMDYRGPPIGWASMPDQFTWQRVAQYALAEDADTPTFTELATLSSHAPWYPAIEPLEDWDALGDGEVFSRWAGVGEDYAKLWQDPDEMRDYYAPAIDYALATVGGFARRYVDDHTLLIVLGDHQAAPAVIGRRPGRDVPIHVISGDPALLEGFLKAGFRTGTLPPGPESARPMETMRGLLHRLYGEARNATP
ncbi:hypothetical protein [Salinicola halophilus]|uniref:hypothetical protein n=1 Tax=Salinicola halophilus TaxID=184065 RepID=UPI000DA23E3C|nr:hypothetical protein [Salinicola halophilus]